MNNSGTRVVLLTKRPTSVLVLCISLYKPLQCSLCLSRYVHNIIQDYDRLLDSDYRGNTVLMHSAGAGRSATFDAILEAIHGAFSEEEVSGQSMHP